MTQVEEQRINTDVDTATTEEGRFVVNQFYSNIPRMENVKEWYAGFTPEGYNEWARVVNFTEPQHIIDTVVKCGAEGGLELPRDSVCLDIGSGTGIIGQAMQNAGFTDLAALDVSTNFLDSVRERGFYQRHFERFLGQGVDALPEELRDSFDVVTASGVWMPGHMPNAAIEDVHALLHEGGLFVTAMRNSMWSDGVDEGYKERIDGLVEARKFEFVKKDEFWRGTEGGTGLFARQKSTLLVLRKIAC